MDIINQAMLFLLNSLDQLLGSYGLAIVALTFIIRLALWPLNTAQTRSMKKMQELQPKLKEIQERLKDNPQKMQEALMKFYSEHRFNPFSGCLPMLIQIPIFIGLYGVLNSPDFLATAGNESFLFVNKLYNTLHSHAGKPLDNVFSVQKDDKFITAHHALIEYANGKQEDFLIPDINKALLPPQPQPLIPGEPIKFQLDLSSLGISQDYASRVKSFQVDVVNSKTRELEKLKFLPANGQFVSGIPSVKGKDVLHMDVLILLGIYTVLTLLYQRLMQKNQPKPATQADAGQAKMMQMMPLLFVAMFLFVPIPAGALLYLVVVMLMMFFQTWWVNRMDDKNNATPKPSTQVVDIKAESPR